MWIIAGSKNAAEEEIVRNVSFSNMLQWIRHFPAVETKTKNVPSVFPLPVALTPTVFLPFKAIGHP
jgi:hypothetical protein